MASSRVVCAAILVVSTVSLMSGGVVTAVDCSSLILNMADCLSFVTSGSTVEKPEGTCCSGLKTVVRSGPECLCEAFKSSASMGVTLNVTKAATLPAACKVAAPPSARCGLSVVPPASAPGTSPAASAGAPELSAGANVAAPVPAPAPPSSASSLLSVSVVSLISGLLVVLVSCF